MLVLQTKKEIKQLLEVLNSNASPALIHEVHLEIADEVDSCHRTPAHVRDGTMLIYKEILQDIYTGKQKTITCTEHIHNTLHVPQKQFH